MTDITLEALGWNDAFAAQAARCGDRDSAARVIDEIRRAGITDEF